MTAPMAGGPLPAVPHWTEVDWNGFTHDRSIDRRRVHFVDYGSGPALVLLHGMGASWQWWLENIPALGAHYRVIAVDLPGFGASEPLPAPAEMTTHARTVIGLLDQLDVGSATIVGHSMGGLIALEMMSVRRRSIRNLVLVDAGGVPMTERRLSAVLVSLRFFCALLQPRFLRSALASQRWLRRVALRPAFADPDVMSPELARETMMLLNAPGFVDAVAAAGRAVRTAEPEAIDCPVLLVWGDRDILAPIHCAEEMHARLPDSELIVMPGCGHTPNIEVPQRFNDEVLRFLQTH